MKTDKKSEPQADKSGNILFKIFRAGGLDAWEKPAAAAAQFASTLNRSQVVSISHSSDRGDGTVVVWYEEVVE